MRSALAVAHTKSERRTLGCRELALYDSSVKPGRCPNLADRPRCSFEAIRMMKTRVLLVDGNEVVRKGLRAILADRPDWDVCGEAANGRDALIAAASLKPDLIVMDLSLPDMNALEATRQILKRIPKVEVLILSTHDSDLAIRSIFESGARGYILKDDSAADILAALDTLRQHKLLLSPKIAEVVLRGYLAAPAERTDGDATPGPLTARETEIARLWPKANPTRKWPGF